MRIREANISDERAIRAIHLSAFDAVEREIVGKLSVDLLSERTMSPTFALVAETGGDVIGHVAFSPATTDVAGGPRVYILHPWQCAQNTRSVAWGHYSWRMASGGSRIWVWMSCC